METARGEVNPVSTKLAHVQSNTLEALRDLGKPLQSERVEAALNLLKRLSGKQFLPNEKNESEKKEVDYVLERLVRGVGSSRISARTGFFAALVSMLSLFPKISIKEIVSLVKKDLSKGKNVSKSEAADIHMGQVLVYGALIRSGRFGVASEEDQIEILNSLITAGTKRTYLTLVADSFIILLLKMVNKKIFHKIVWPAIQGSAGLNKDWKDRSLDEMYLLLAVRSHFPSVIPDSQSLLNPENIPHCASLLVTIPNISYIKHPVYEEYCRQLASTEFLSLFWSEVEKQLSKPYRNRQLIALEMLGHIISHMPDKNMIPTFITPAFISLAHKSKSSKKHPQEKDMLDVFVKVKQVFPVMMKNLENEAVKEKTKVEVLKKLLFHPGNFMFERNTGLKVVQPVTTSLTANGVKKLSKVYREVVSGKVELKEGDEYTKKRMPAYKVLPWKNKERIYAAQLLARLVGAPAMANEREWKLNQVKFLLHWGVYHKHFGQSASGDFVGLELSHALRESFFRSLDHRSGGLGGSIDLLLNLVLHVDELLKDDSVEDKVLKGMSLEDWDKAMVVIHKLKNQAEEEDENESKPKGKIGEAKFFLILFLQLVLQLFDWDAGLAADSLAELNSCYTRLEQEKKNNKVVKSEVKPTPKKKKRSMQTINSEGAEMKVNGEQEDEDPAWVEVVVDLFLHLLSQNRHLLRTMINSVFTHLCPQLTPTALHSILQVLDPRSGKNPLKGKDDSDDEESEDEESDEESKKSEGSSDKEEGEDDMSGDESEGDNAEEPTVNETLRLAVQKALGSSAPTSDTESVDVDEIGEEEGQQLDTALSDAFHLLRNTKDSGKAKKQQTKDEKTLTHFRVRAVDLLEIYIESVPSLALCCGLILPLLETLEFCIKDVHQKPLENRLRSCLRKLSNVKSFSSVEGMDNTILSDLLNAILDKGSRTAPIFLDMGNEITSCCTYIIRASEYLRKENEKAGTVKLKKKDRGQSSRVSEIYKKSLETFFTRRDCVLPVGMFRQALQLPWAGCWSLVSPLVEFSFDSEVRPFRRNQALQLLTTFFLNQSLVSTPDPVYVEDLVSLKQKINSHSIDFLESMKKPEDSSNIKKKHLMGLMSLLQAIRSSEAHIKKIKNESPETDETVNLESICEAFDWNTIGTSLSAIYCGGMRGVGPDGKRAVAKVLKLMGLGELIARHQKEKLQKAKAMAAEAKAAKTEPADEDGSEKSETEPGNEDESEESDEEEKNDNKSETNMPKKNKEKEKREKKKRRKKASKIESRKHKKEAKNFRLQEFSKGLEDASFAGVGQFPEAMNEDEEVVLENSVGTSKIGKSKKRKNDSMPNKVKKLKKVKE